MDVSESAPTSSDRLSLSADGRCEFTGCDHPDAQYRITIETLILDGKREALSCRQHVALVAKALSEDLRDRIREGYQLAEMDEMEEQRGATRDRVAAEQQQEEEGKTG